MGGGESPQFAENMFTLVGPAYKNKQQRFEKISMKKPEKPENRKKIQYLNKSKNS